MTDDRRRWRYPPELRDAVLAFGLVPKDTTPPALVREAVDDLYRLELRSLRDALRAGRVPRPAFHDEVVALRRKYWVLTLNLAAWERICDPDDPG